MSFASDSSNGGFVPSCLYMSCSLSSCIFLIAQTVVPSGLCRDVCVCVCVCVCVYVVWGGVRVRIGGFDRCLDLG